MPSSQAIADEVATNPDAIGYYGMGYVNSRNVAIAVAKTTAGPYEVPSEKTVRLGSYPVARPLFVYSAEKPQGLAKAFLDFTQSPEGQAIVRETDFVTVQ